MSRTRIVITAVTLIATVAFAGTSAQVARAPVEIRIPAAPVAVAGSDGHMHLAYELHVTNFYRSSGVHRLERVDAFGDLDPTRLLSHSGTDLDGRVVHPGAEPSARYGRSIEGGMRAVVYLWITLQKGSAIPRSLRHRLVFLRDTGTDEIVVDDARINVRTVKRILLGPPLSRGIWLVHNGPGNHRSPHWGSQLALNGRVTVPQRFAVDFIGLDENGSAVRGDFRKSANEDWIGFGTEVVAVADGVVRDMTDGAADRAPLAPVAPSTDPTAAATYGNYVVVDLGSGTFVHYAHLQRNSVSVKVGQRIRRGQVLGRLGNSGNTNAPHLHFNVTDAASPEDSEGLPFAFDSFELLGETTAERAIGAESLPATPGFSPEKHRRELPLHGAVVRFP